MFVITFDSKYQRGFLKQKQDNLIELLGCLRLVLNIVKLKFVL